MSSTDTKITIYTDGAYSSSRDKGGWAFVVVSNDEKIFSNYGTIEKTTNNRMEIQSCIESLKWVKENNISEVSIISDSMYVIGTMSKNWKKKVNIDLWIEMEKAIENININWIHVKGHSGNKWNEYCDTYACHASQIEL